MGENRQKFREGELLLRMSEGPFRLRIVVSKKVAKQAVRRNRIRRVLREASRKELGAAKEGQGMVLTVLPGFRVTKTQEAQEILRRLFRKASL